MKLKETYLSKNKDGYYQFRKRVPQDLQPILKKSQIYRSLKTRRYRDALVLCQLYADEYERLFQRLRRQHRMTKDNEKDELLRWSESDEAKYLVEQAVAFTQRKIKFDLGLSEDGILRPFRVELDPDKMEAELELYDKALAITAKRSADFRHQTVAPIIPQSKTDASITPQQLIPETLTAAQQPPVFTISTAQPPAASATLSPRVKVSTLSELREIFYQKQIATKKWTAPKNKLHYHATLLLFEKFFGDRQMHTYHEIEAEDFITRLQKIPKNWLSSKATKHLSYEKVIKLKRPRMKNNSVLAHLTRIKNFFKFAENQRYVDENIFKFIELPKERGLEREPFTEEELRILFEPENFLSFQKEGYASRYWAPLLAAFTGCRKGELFFLDVNSIYMISQNEILDVFESEELEEFPCDSVQCIWVIEINKNEKTALANQNAIKKIKTAESRRIIPLHNKFLKYGFIEFLEERKKDKSDNRLFTEYNVILEEAGTGFSNTFSRWIKKTVSAMSPETRGELFPEGRGIHSFRHLFISESREREMSEETSRRLSGHTLPGDKDVHAGYGGKISKRLQIRRLFRQNLELQKLDPSRYFPELPTYAEITEKRRQREAERAEAQIIKRRKSRRRPKITEQTEALEGGDHNQE